MKRNSHVKSWKTKTVSRELNFTFFFLRPPRLYESSYPVTAAAVLQCSDKRPHYYECNVIIACSKVELARGVREIYFTELVKVIRL